MTTEHAATQRAENLPIPTATTLARVAAQTGPCLSIIVPDRHPGAPESPQKTQVRVLMDAALGKNNDAAWAAQVRASVEEFATRSIAEGGGPGFVVYATSGGVQCCQSGGGAARSVVASHPLILPLLESTAASQELWVLCLSTKHVQLYVYAEGVAMPVALPAGVPANLDAAGHFHQGGEPGQSNTPGGKGGVRFGTSGMRESAHDSIQHFCALIDQGLRTLMADRPLLLMGVKEEIAAYRRVSHYHSLLHTEVDGNADVLSAAQIATHAHRAVVEEYRRLGAEVLAEFREMRDRARALDDAHAVLEAATGGRVHKVCLRAGTELLGANGEDVLNAIAVETLRKGGEVYLLPQDQMPVTQAVCAILRY